ncbi:hypothetical protein H2202_007031 [Exophiala xenobiotica]|nr:hypothetical protein H2202_007031 [Exophiala xenobiotica]KAK5200432.1 hypothetical protein LTR92_000975 [Exophiala xenobiotica]KAK5217565.1 hypothetical protein LTR72_009682 [Exophiala xenobiotica]KAK5232914.1 hypothetical protein LTR47_006141 [Exophiala xenobiotica]KAK5255347.1 hypothetical protein LTS06_000368 [Exophiala xenobiotica]
MADRNSLRTVSRFVTGHNKVDGTSVFQIDVGSSPPVRQLPDGMQIFDCYMTQGFPINVAGESDISVYERLIHNPPGIVVPNGSAARIVDIPPAYTSPMHRSMSLNYNFVIEGEVDVLLDSGETRSLRRGDVLVQRAINHAWRNRSETEWARITAVVLPVQDIQVGGTGLQTSRENEAQQVRKDP